MKHIIDETYEGHEIVFMQETEGKFAGTFAVDIRIDDFDGELIGGYCEMLNINDCRNKATGFIDGWETKGE